MAYINQEKKAQLLPQIKAILREYGMKASVGVRNYSTLTVKITEGPLDLIGNYNRVVAERSRCQPDHMKPHVCDGYMDVNPYWKQEHFDGRCLEFIVKLFEAMNDGNHDKSDISTDYFDVGWYTSVKVGSYEKSYQFTGKKPHLTPKASELRWVA